MVFGEADASCGRPSGSPIRLAPALDSDPLFPLMIRSLTL
jgi:hypothetical protein